MLHLSVGVSLDGKPWFRFWFKQELSYCKQIAHQLHTQYVKGINRNPVTLKSRLRVTQDIENGAVR